MDVSYRCSLYTSASISSFFFVGAAGTAAVVFLGVVTIDTKRKQIVFHSIYSKHVFILHKTLFTAKVIFYVSICS